MESASPLGLLGNLPSEVRNNMYDKLFRASYYGNWLAYYASRPRHYPRIVSKGYTLSILRTSRTISAEASVVLYARSAFEFDPADREIEALKERPQLINYKRIRNLRVIIDYDATLMNHRPVHVLDARFMRGFDEGRPESDNDSEIYTDCASLVEFRETILYAFFLDLPISDQALKTFTLCLTIEDDKSLARLMSNTTQDPLVAMGFVRTLTMFTTLRKVVIELNTTSVSLHERSSKVLQTSQLFQRLSNWLGPCVEEKSVQKKEEGKPVQKKEKGQKFSQRFTFFPAAYSESEIAKEA